MQAESMPNFIAVDGEALDDKYALMCCSEDGTRTPPMFNPDGLSTEACFNYLLSLPKGVVVCFGLNYDVNNWLRDVPKPYLRALWRDGTVVWSNYRLKWIPRKLFTIEHADKRKVTVNEVWGFFQSSFLKALEAWELPATETLKSGKSDRGGFTQKELDRIVMYCREECHKLVELMSKLAAACEVAGIVPRSWIGAGSLANALLNNNGVKGVHKADAELGDLEPILGSYYGGRVEILKQGSYSPVLGADIVSAYPAAAMNLPALNRAKLVPCDSLPQRGIAYVKWNVKPIHGVCPFPVRKDNGIYYPMIGAGWYHAWEVRKAMQHFSGISVVKAYALKHWEPDALAWIPDVFKVRRQFKSEGNAAEKPLKLALNSVYGKFAQGIGKGKYRSYYWAGEITAITRAKMLEYLIAADDPIAVCTDGVYMQGTNPLSVESTELGGWEHTDYTEFESFQSGVYRAWLGAVPVLRSRGFFAREIDYADLLVEYEENGVYGHVHYDSTRFIGLGQALKLKDFSKWRTWDTSARTVSLYPARKQVLADGTLAPVECVGESEPYEPKCDIELEEQVMDQPLKIDSPS